MCVCVCVCVCVYVWNTGLDVESTCAWNTFLLDFQMAEGRDRMDCGEESSPRAKANRGKRKHPQMVSSVLFI